MAHYSRYIDDIVEGVFRKHATTGNWAAAQVAVGEGMFSCSLFDYSSAEQPYFYAVHRYIIDELHDGHGIYTKKRNAAFLKIIRDLVDQPVLGPKDLVIGDRLKLTAVQDISKEYREASVGGLDMLVSDNIVDLVDCLEEHGYQDTYGSCFSNEILLVKRDKFWRRFEGIGKLIITIDI